MTHPPAPLARALRDLEDLDSPPDRDEILNHFLAYEDDLGLELYPAQEEAILELLEWKHVILNTPTGSGKSLVAIATHFQAMAEGRTSYYTCPIKALVNEKFFDLGEAFGPENVGLLTGDASVNREAPIICCTAEILSNMVLRQDKHVVDYVVMDEFHFYGDRDRGVAWHLPLVSMPDTVFLLMSATLGDTTHIASKLAEYTQREVAFVYHGERPVPLEFEYRETPLHETVQELLDAEEAPIYLVNFTQRSSAEEAQNLTSLKICKKEERAIIAEELDRTRIDTPYGKELRRFLLSGIGIHHAGLLPKYRLLVEKLAQAGLLKVVSGTDSLGVGVNIPIRTVLFRALSKYDGEKTRLLSARQFHQIAGRAGRKGFDDRGKVVVQAPDHIIENKKIAAKLVKNPHLKNKTHKKKPPTRGYVHWDKSTFEKLVASPPEPLEPQFAISHGMVMNALQSSTERKGGGYRKLVEIISRSHITPAKKKIARRRAASLFRSLVRAEIVSIERNLDGPGSHVKIRPDLQFNFSLNQSLSLFLVEALDLIDPEGESHVLEVLSLVEAILEDPSVILFRQIDKIKGELIGRLKAEGVPYEERMEALEQVEYPKPGADFIYENFNAFAKHPPWLDGENIKPKSIAREMYESGFTFEGYVRDLGLARSEGVLIRYLSQLYKTCVQNIPESFWTEEFQECISYFGTMLRGVDSSLLDEWERMMRGEIVRIRDRNAPQEKTAEEFDILDDFSAFSARIRNELFFLLRSLADREYEEALTRIRRGEETEWTAERLRRLMEPFYEEHASIDVTPRARQVHNTFIRESAPRIYEVQHKILDAEGDNDWAIRCIVDVRENWDTSLPLIELREIGI